MRNLKLAVSDKKLFDFYREKYPQIHKVNSYLAADYYKLLEADQYGAAFRALCNHVHIRLENSYFIQFFDFRYVNRAGTNVKLSNITLNYEKLLQNGLEGLKYSKQSEIRNQKFCKDYNDVIEGMMDLSRRVVKKLRLQKPLDYEKKIQWFDSMCNQKALHFDEAIQRILFLNQIAWQTGHKLIGLGSLDSVLWSFYEADLKAGLLTPKAAFKSIVEFYRLLHKNFWFKSGELVGDTGQIIVLGKTDTNGAYHSNQLTYLFIKAMKYVQLPDPKVLLRVSSKTPKKLLACAVDCIATGVGMPLLSNDDQVIPRLVAFGIEKEDACNYTTSACWEPLIGGKSSDNNNIYCLNYMEPLDKLVKKENLDRIESFDQLLDLYFKHLKVYISRILIELKKIKYEYDPFMSAFIDGCYEAQCDVSRGGAIYNHFGITTVGLSNTINAFINIKSLVFEQKRISLSGLKRKLNQNFEDLPEYKEVLKSQSPRYGDDDEEIISLVNRITKFTTEETIEFRNYLGGKLKFGLSSPAYISMSKDFPASLDGRVNGEAFAVHISSERQNGYTHLVNFASRLDYAENRFNGNVVDFMIIPDFIRNNADKFTAFLMAGIQAGFYQMQLNVISSEILIKAKENPKEFPNLIVRVWGFSAYFNDLPEEYKDVLIERALHNEGRNQ